MPLRAFILSTSPRVYRRFASFEAGKTCSSRTLPNHHGRSILLQKVIESGTQLNRALAASDSAGNWNQEHWQNALANVTSAVEYYAGSLENYRQALVTELAPFISGRPH